MRICFACGAELTGREKVPFKELCPKCEAYLHCCRNCRLFAQPNHCLSNTTEKVAEIEKANYCDEFEFREMEDRRASKKAASSSSASSSKSEKHSDPSDEARQKTAREKFDSLFKD